MIPDAKILYKSKDGNTYTPLTHFVSIKIAEALDAKTNNASIDLTNPHNLYTASEDFTFQSDDLLEIYLSNTTIDTTIDTPFFTGGISEIKPDTSQGGRRINIKLQDRTSLLLGRRYMKGFSNQTAPQIVTGLVSWANGVSDQNNLPNINTTHVDTLRPTTLIEGSTIGGDAFPPIDLNLGWKTIYEYLQEVSQTPNLNTIDERTTGLMPVTKPYMFWIGRVESDGTAPLYWTTRQNNTVSSYPIIEGTEGIYSINLKKSVHDVVNMIIFGVGQDLNGNGVTWYAINDQSNLPELRSRYMSFIDVHDALIDSKVDKDTYTTLNGAVAATDTTITLTSAAAFETNGAILVNNEFIEYTGKSTNDLTGCKRGSYGTNPQSYKTGGRVFAADAMSTITNTDFRQELRDLGVARAMRTMMGMEGLIWKGKASMRGNDHYTVGDYVTITSPSYGITGLNFRITNLENEFNKGGWTTNITITEEINETTQTYSGG